MPPIATDYLSGLFARDTAAPGASRAESPTGGPFDVELDRARRSAVPPAYTDSGPGSAAPKPPEAQPSDAAQPPSGPEKAPGAADHEPRAEDRDSQSVAEETAPDAQPDNGDEDRPSDDESPDDDELAAAAAAAAAAQRAEASQDTAAAEALAAQEAIDAANAAAGKDPRTAIDGTEPVPSADATTEEQSPGEAKKQVKLSVVEQPTLDVPPAEATAEAKPAGDADAPTAIDETTGEQTTGVRRRPLERPPRAGTHEAEQSSETTEAGQAVAQDVSAAIEASAADTAQASTADGEGQDRKVADVNERTTDLRAGEAERPSGARANAAAGRAQTQGAAASDQSDRVRFVQRVAKAFEAMGDREGSLRLRLHPPELGSVRLEMTIRNGTMTAKLEADTPAARTLLLENLPALRERLAEHEIKIQRFDVDLSERALGGSPQGTPEQQQSPRRQPQARPGAAGAKAVGSEGASRPAAARRTESGRLDVTI